MKLQISLCLIWEILMISQVLSQNSTTNTTIVNPSVTPIINPTTLSTAVAVTPYQCTNESKNLAIVIKNYNLFDFLREITLLYVFIFIQKILEWPFLLQ
jgi:hypothetical protein